MKPPALISVIALLSGCSTLQDTLVWRARELALAPSSTITLLGRDEKIVVTVNRLTLQQVLISHIRISRSAGVPSELLITEGEEPNAFVGLMSGRRVTVINTGMIKLIGDDIDEYAALLGHEAAHWAKGHVEKGSARSSTIQGIGTLVGVGLGMAGIPAAGVITGLGADLIEAAYSRDDEREADALGIDYVIANGFDPNGAVRLHEKVLKLPGETGLPFLTGHPSGEERIETLKRLIAAKRSQPSAK